MTTLKYTFEIGKIYQMSFIGDSDLKPEYTCVSRTDKTAKFQSVKHNECFSKKIKISNDSEYVLSGSYSMAPCIKASRLVK